MKNNERAVVEYITVEKVTEEREVHADLMSPPIQDPAPDVREKMLNHAGVSPCRSDQSHRNRGTSSTRGTRTNYVLGDIVVTGTQDQKQNAVGWLKWGM